MPSVRPMSDTTGYRPLSRIPERRSSRLFQSHTEADTSAPASNSHHRPISIHHTLKPPEVVTVRGKSVSPIKIKRPSIGDIKSRTFVPAVAPTDILDVPRLTHPRLSLDVRLSASLFVGGATIEGEVQIKIDGDSSDRRRRSLSALSITRVSVSVVGVEHCTGRQEIFRALTTNVLHISDEAVTEDVVKPFTVDLPVVMGPPPYRTKKAGIRYLLSCLVEMEISAEKHFVRQSREVIVLTVHDPEKALVNLSNPLVVNDALQMSRQNIYVTAGIHRQTWIGGYLLFVDLHIDNQSDKAVRKIELQLERATVYYIHSAPSVGKTSADVLRLPDQIHKEILVRKNVLPNFEGIRPISQDFRTAQISIPNGLVSIETGRYFGVRYFLNVQISCSFSKRLRVQLPITLIHPNSIDIPPNALAQVTASIEHKHRNLSSTNGSGSAYRYHPGQAFTAARRQSYLQLRHDTFGSTDLDSITRAVENSPRKFHPATQRSSSLSPKKMKVTRRQLTAALGSSSHHHRRQSSKHASFDNGLRYKFSKPSLETSRLYGDGRGGGSQRVSFDNSITATAGANRAMRSDLESNVFKHLGIGSDGSSGRRMVPRLQRSTSGMGFSDSDKENVAPKGRFI